MLRKVLQYIAYQTFGIDSMNNRRSIDVQILMSAENAIECSERQERLLGKLWGSLAVSQAVIRQACQRIDFDLISTAEQELLESISSMRTGNSVVTGERSCNRRPLTGRKIFV